MILILHQCFFAGISWCPDISNLVGRYRDVGVRRETPRLAPTCRFDTIPGPACRCEQNSEMVDTAEAWHRCAGSKLSPRPVSTSDCAACGEQGQSPGWVSNTGSEGAGRAIFPLAPLPFPASREIIFASLHLLNGRGKRCGSPDARSWPEGWPRLRPAPGCRLSLPPKWCSAQRNSQRSAMATSCCRADFS